MPITPVQRAPERSEETTPDGHGGPGKGAGVARSLLVRGPEAWPLTQKVKGRHPGAQPFYQRSRVDSPRADPEIDPDPFHRRVFPHIMDYRGQRSTAQGWTQRLTQTTEGSYHTSWITEVKGRQPKGGPKY